MGRPRSAGRTARLARRASLNENCAQEPCSYCGVELRSRPYVVCAECAMPTVSLCLNCFAAGAAWVPHNAAHDYRVISEMNAPVFEGGWAAAEEFRLLDAIAAHGPFSWTAVAEVVGSKSARECEAHYIRVYIDSRTAPLPDYDFMYPCDNSQQHAPAGNHQARALSAAASDVARMRVEKPKRRIQPIPVLSSSDSSSSERVVRGGRGQNISSSPGQRGGCDSEELNPTTETNTEVLDASRSRATSVPRVGRRFRRQQGKGDSSESEDEDDSESVVSSERQDTDDDESDTSDDGHLPGYYFKRGDFDSEWDDLAEESIAKLRISESDTTEEVELKLRLLELYNIRLDERESVKRFALSNSLVDICRLSQEEESVPDDEREIRRWLKRFGRVLNPEQQLELERALLAEHCLIQEVALLASYSSLGIRNFAQLRTYNTDASIRMRELGYDFKSGTWKSSSDPTHDISTNSAAFLKIAEESREDSQRDVAAKENDLSHVDSVYSLLRSGGNALRSQQLSSIEREICSILRLSADEFADLKSALVREVDAVGYERCDTDEEKVTFVELSGSSSDYRPCAPMHRANGGPAGPIATNSNHSPLWKQLASRSRLLSRLEASREGFSWNEASLHVHPSVFRIKPEVQNRPGYPSKSVGMRNYKRHPAWDHSRDEDKGLASVDRSHNLLSVEGKVDGTPPMSTSSLNLARDGGSRKRVHYGKPSAMSIAAFRTEPLNLKLRLFNDAIAVREKASSIAVAHAQPACYAEVIDDEMTSRMRAIEERAFRSAFCNTSSEERDTKEILLKEALHSRTQDCRAAEPLLGANKSNEGAIANSRSDLKKRWAGPLSGKSGTMRTEDHEFADRDVCYTTANHNATGGNSSAVAETRRNISSDVFEGWRKPDEAALSTTSSGARKAEAGISGPICKSLTPMKTSGLALAEEHEIIEDLPSLLPGQKKNVETRNLNTRDPLQSRLNYRPALGEKHTAEGERTVGGPEGGECDPEAPRNLIQFDEQTAPGTVQYSECDGSRDKDETPRMKAGDHSRDRQEHVRHCILNAGDRSPKNTDGDCVLLSGDARNRGSRSKRRRTTYVEALGTPDSLPSKRRRVVRGRPVSHQTGCNQNDDVDRSIEREPDEGYSPNNQGGQIEGGVGSEVEERDQDQSVQHTSSANCGAPAKSCVGNASRLSSESNSSGSRGPPGSSIQRRPPAISVHSLRSHDRRYPSRHGSR